VREQGWYLDPYGLHSERWYSAGTPTNLVRDDGTESRNAPPPVEPAAAPMPLSPAPNHASDLKRADEVAATAGLFEADLSCSAPELAGKPWWLPTTRVRRGYVAAGLWFGVGAAELIASFFLAAGHLRIEAVLWLVGAAWIAASAFVTRRRQRATLIRMFRSWL
jgi:hypothetical protein